MPKIDFRVSQQYLDAIDALATQLNYNERVDLITDALREFAARHDTTLPPHTRPRGYANHQLPPGWKSPFYKDRYQLIVVLANNDYIITHRHATDLDNLPPIHIGTIRADDVQPTDGHKVEVEIYSHFPIPDHNRDNISHDLRFEINEWLADHAL